jgi:hypothetical protein
MPSPFRLPDEEPVIIVGRPDLLFYSRYARTDKNQATKMCEAMTKGWLPIEMEEGEDGVWRMIK